MRLSSCEFRRIGIQESEIASQVWSLACRVNGSVGWARRKSTIDRFVISRSFAAGLSEGVRSSEPQSFLRP